MDDGQTDTPAFSLISANMVRKRANGYSQRNSNSKLLKRFSSTALLGPVCPAHHSSTITSSFLSENKGMTEELLGTDSPVVKI